MPQKVGVALVPCRHNVLTRVPPSPTLPFTAQWRKHVPHCGREPQLPPHGCAWVCPKPSVRPAWCTTALAASWMARGRCLLKLVKTPPALHKKAKWLLLRVHVRFSALLPCACAVAPHCDCAAVCVTGCVNASHGALRCPWVPYSLRRQASKRHGGSRDAVRHERSE